MPAGSLEQVVFRMDVLHAAAARGMPVLNPPRAVETCVDKYLTNVRLAAAGLPTPPTHVAQRADDAFAAFDGSAATSCVKPLFGAEGRGMLRVTDRELAWRTFRVLEQTRAGDLPAAVHPAPRLGPAGVRDGRQGDRARCGGVRANDWRTNVAQGGTAERAELIAARGGTGRARRRTAVGCPVAGVDLLPGPRGELYVIEVNAVPGWRALAPDMRHRHGGGRSCGSWRRADGDA